MKHLAKLCPASAWLSVRVVSWSGMVAISCGLVDDGTQYYSGYSVKDAEQAFRHKYGLCGVRLRRVSY